MVQPLIARQFVTAATLNQLEETSPPSWGETLGRAGWNAIQYKHGAHAQSVAQTGIGHYYGSQSAYAKWSPEQRAEWAAQQPTTGASPPTPRESDCMQWSMEVLESAYSSAGRRSRWLEIAAEVTRHSGRGDILAKELRKDGWMSVYWNPDTRQPRDGDAEHSFTAAKAARGEPYYGVPVDGNVVDYAPSHGGAAQAENAATLEELKRSPFFFGIARGGRHTFVGGYGNIAELHWEAMPSNPAVIEQKRFEAFDWLSGVILLPPGTWAGGGR
jgi:hypothetical protein